MSKSKTTILIFMLITLLLLICMTNASADLINLGEKSASYSYILSNIDDYDNYVFLLYGTTNYGPMTQPQIINSGDAIFFYKAVRPSIYAVKSTEFNESILYDYDNFNNYFENDPTVLHSNIVLEPIYNIIPENDPLVSSQVILEITTLDDTQFDIKKTSIIFTYEDGSSEEKAFLSQDAFPMPSIILGSSPFQILWYIGLPLLGISGVLLMIIRRRER